MGIICRAISLQIRYHNRMATDEIRLDSTRTPEMAVSPPKPARFHWALTALGIATILGLCYWAELVLAVMMFSVMLAFILAPVVDFLMRWSLPRGVAALISVILLVAIVAALLYYTSNQAATFFQDVPQYAGKIRTAVMNFRQRAESFGGLRPQEQSGRSSTDWTGPLKPGVGSGKQGLVAASFVPFLVYFMLTWQHHVRSAPAMLFSLENRLKLNPLPFIVAFLVWGWLWGVIGLLLAIPITAAMKIVFDHVHSLKPYGAWLGE